MQLQGCILGIAKLANLNCTIYLDHRLKVLLMAPCQSLLALAVLQDPTFNCEEREAALIFQVLSKGSSTAPTRH